MRLSSTYIFMLVSSVVLSLSTIAHADLDDEAVPAPIPSAPPPPPVEPEKPVKKDAPPAKGSTKSTPGNSDKKATSNSSKKTKTAPDSGDRKQPVKWKSKGLKATKEKGVMELSEDVVVTQGDLQLKANHAKLYYDDKTDEVSRVVVTGNVKITKSSADPKDRITGMGNEGVFYNSERKVVLKGNAQLIRGEDILKGKQITYELDTGWISVDNVEGVMQPGDKKQ